MLCAYLMINFGWLRETTWTLQILQQGAGAYIVELAQKVGAMSAVCALLHYIWKLHIFGNGCGYKRKSKESISHRKKKELTRINEEYKSYETSSLYSSFSFNNSEASLFQLLIILRLWSSGWDLIEGYQARSQYQYLALNLNLFQSLIERYVQSFERNTNLRTQETEWKSRG